MTKEFFERHYGLLSNRADATEVFGTGIEPGVATVGDIRRKLEGHSRSASIYAEWDGSGFCVNEVERKTAVGWR